jgi:transcriptional regulator with XRE-family HTH domain
MAREIREARLGGGASLRIAAGRVGISHAQLGRIERGVVSGLSISQLSRACAAVGLQLLVRALPGSGAALDAGQLALIGRLRAVMPPSVRARTEVPLPIPGDRRAWDVVVEVSPNDLPIEAETRLRDIQALERRTALKRRDSGYQKIVLLVSDTANNRRMLELHRQHLRASFPLDTRAVLAALRRGHTPSASGIVIL